MTATSRFPSCRLASSSPLAGCCRSFLHSMRCRTPRSGVPSLIMAIPIFLFVAKIPGRRRAATKASIPFYVGFLLLLQFLAGAYLVLNAVGWPAPPDLAPFAVALTVLLFTTGIAYLIALARALRGDRGQT